MVAEEDAQLSSYVGRTVRAFISYSTEDKILAGLAKEGLEKYGLETFLAHEDIEPASEWQQTILENLESTDVFIPIITENFSASKWTDQESGIAFTREKVIVPIGVDGVHSYGFIGRFQSMNVNSAHPIDCAEIIKAIIRRKPSFESQILDSAIKSFAASRSWSAAKERARLLVEFPNMTSRQVNEILNAATQNSEIKGSFGARDVIPTLYEKYKTIVDPAITAKLLEEKLISTPVENDLF